jgi:hypothetical protein
MNDGQSNPAVDGGSTPADSTCTARQLFSECATEPSAPGAASRHQQAPGDKTEGVQRGSVRANTKSSHRKLARPRFNAHRAPTVRGVRNGAEQPRSASRHWEACTPRLTDATQRVRRGGERANTKPSNRKLARPEFSVRRLPTVVPPTIGRTERRRSAAVPQNRAPLVSPASRLRHPTLDAHFPLAR